MSVRCLTFRVTRSMLLTAVPACLLLLMGSKFAFAAKPPLLLGCQTRSETVHPGEPVTVTASPLNLDAKRPADYTWQSTGGRLTPAGATVTINTPGLPPGEYTVTGRLVQGAKPNQQAVCNTRFRVMPFEPPSVSCRAVPNTAPSGTSIDINTTAVSLQNRPLTYAYSATAGQIVGSGVTAKLATKGVPAGLVTVTCFVVDDRGLSASTTTQITLSKPLMPNSGGTRQLCTLLFSRDRLHPARMDAAAETCMDSVAFTLRQNPEAKLVLVGNASPSEPPELAAERVLNARQYLTNARGIALGRLEVRTGETSGPTANNILVPAGADPSGMNAQPFDETLIVRHGQAYVPPALAGRKSSARSGTAY